MTDINVPQGWFAMRPQAGWRGYLPVMVVLTCFTAIGILERGFWNELYLVLLLTLTIVQLRYRTMFGWFVLFCCAVLYTLMALYQMVMVLSFPTFANRALWLSTLIAICGIVSAIGLLISRPWRASEDTK